ncbi:MAG: Trigger factor [Alphaproteobacteria bacterium ADurb.Bin438]|nr:MAG: Trigger factor [Alphaproteobacteria bacterium ADurb.Bin438]
MKITEKTNEGLKREYGIVVPNEDIATKVAVKLEEIATKVSLPGFRPGKAPKDLIKKKYEEAVSSEVAEEEINKAVDQIIKEKSLKPAYRPDINVESYKFGTDLSFELSLEVIPEIEIKPFDNITLDKFVVEISDKEIDERIEFFANRQKEYKNSDSQGPVKTGDVVLIDFVGSTGGVEFKGGKGEDYDLEIGSNSFIPGFEDQLVGAKVGDIVDVNVDFPKEYHAKDLAGKPALFKVTVKAIREAVKVEINDEFAKKFGQESLESLKKMVRESISHDYEMSSKMALKKRLLDALSNEYDFEVPSKLKEMEFGAIWKQIEDAKAKGQLDEEDKDKSDEELKAEYQDIAERRVRLGILMAEIGEANQIKVEQKDLNKAIFEEASRYRGYEQQVIEQYTKNPRLIEGLKAPIFEEKVVDFIISKVKLNESKVSKEEALKKEEEANEPAKKKAAPKKKTKAKKEEE